MGGTLEVGLPMTTGKGDLVELVSACGMVIPVTLDVRHIEMHVVLSALHIECTSHWMYVTFKARHIECT